MPSVAFPGELLSPHASCGTAQRPFPTARAPRYDRRMSIALLLTFYCICVFAASLAGGALPSLIKLTHRGVQLVMSFVGGLMLGVALLHLVPHALVELGSIDGVTGWTLGGLIAMFLLIRVFHVHAHEHGDTSDLVDPHQH